MARRFVAAFVVFGFLPLWSLAAAASATAGHTLHRQVDQHLESSAAAARVYVEQQLAALRLQISSFAQRPDVEAALVAEPSRAADRTLAVAMARLRGTVPGATSIFATDPQGRIVAATTTTSIRGRDFSFRDWYRGVRRVDGPYVSTAYTTVVDGHVRVVAAAAPVRGISRTGRPGWVGVVGIADDLSTMQAYITAAGRAQGLLTRVVDGNGVVVAGQVGDVHSLERVGTDPAARRALAGGSGMMTRAFAGAPLARVAFQPVGDGDWAVTVEEPTAAAFAALHRLNVVIELMTGGLSLLLLIALALALRAAWQRARADETAETSLAALRESERRMRGVFDAAPAGMARVSDTGELLEVNAAFAALIGVPAEALVGARFDALCADVPAGYQRFLDDVAGGEDQVWQWEQRMHRASGERFWGLVSVSRDRDPDATGAALFQLLDITERKRAEQDLGARAHRDPLTGLPNRAVLVQRLEAALLAGEGGEMAVLFVDLDRFKPVNDRLGHEVGDFVLAEVARRLSGCLRRTDIVGRIGGDEFLVVAHAAEGPEAVTALAERIRAAVALPIEHSGQLLSIGCSVGIATPEGLAETAATLIARADAAMYAAKRSGTGVLAYTDSLRSRVEAKTRVEGLLRRAVAEDRLLLHYQPVVELATGRIVGVESLLRLVDDDGSLLPPATFIPVAEDTGLIVEIGRWVLAEACAQGVVWKRRLPADADFGIAVNVSVRQLHEPDFATLVAATVDAAGLDRDALVVEVTESILMDGSDANHHALRRLHDIGVRIAIDDFGRGASSLSYLRDFPVDILKVDRTFIRDLGLGEVRSRVAEAVVGLAKHLDLIVVAEGVEEPAQIGALQRLGCPLAQGFLLSRPVPAEVIDGLVDGPVAPRVTLPRRARQKAAAPA